MGLRGGPPCNVMHPENPTYNPPPKKKPPFLPLKRSSVFWKCFSWLWGFEGVLCRVCVVFGSKTVEIFRAFRRIHAGLGGFQGGQWA